ncbi:MAG TPA: alpha/beta hydrolase [Longimicrobium sp.]|nr:alpha/beta hydrolase [Longimicrobium sp.]
MSDSLLPPPAESSTLRAADGTRLHVLRWPAERPRAALLLSHGLGEHAGRYAALARDLVPLGIEVQALDHRGHGRSGGPRAYTPRFSRFVDDFEAFRRHAAATLPASLPVFLLGHSLGGLIALRWLEAHPEAGLAGAILSAPLLGIRKEAARWKVALSGLLSKLLPWVPIPNEIDPAELSSDPAYVRSYREDPLVHAKITPRLYTEMVKAMGDAVAEKDRIALPLLFLVPGADSIVREEETLRFAEGLAGDVTVRRYPGFRHESLNELERARPVADVVGWMEARIG